eukprot:PhF_6_TR5082/c0_g1_i1/m.7128
MTRIIHSTSALTLTYEYFGIRFGSFEVKLRLSIHRIPKQTISSGKKLRPTHGGGRRRQRIKHGMLPTPGIATLLRICSLSLFFRQFDKWQLQQRNKKVGGEKKRKFGPDRVRVPLRFPRMRYAQVLSSCSLTAGDELSLGDLILDVLCNSCDVDMGGEHITTTWNDLHTPMGVDDDASWLIVDREEAMHMEHSTAQGWLNVLKKS